MNQIKNNLKKLLAEDKIQEVIDFLRKIAVTREEIVNDLVLIEARFKKISNESIKGTSPYDAEFLFYNQLRHSLLILIDEYFNSEGQKADKKTIHESEQLLDEKEFIRSEAEIYYRLGNINFAKQEYDKAISNYKKAVEILPDWCKPHANLYLTYSEIGETYEAQNSLRIANSLHHLAIDFGTTNMAITYAALGEHIKAIELYENLINSYPDSKNAYLKGANTSREINDKTKELFFLTKFMEKFGDTSDNMKLITNRIEKLIIEITK